MRLMTNNFVSASTLVLCIACSLVHIATTAKAEVPAHARKTEWNGFDQFHFEVEGRAAYVVTPETVLPGRPWIWRARFPGYHAEMDLALVKRGFHLGYVDVAGLFGCPRAIEIGNAFYLHLTTEWRLSKRPALEGVSRGGLFVYNWAAANTGKFSCIYCDTPVCDFKSWPAGKGTGLGAPGAWRQCLDAYGLDEAAALKYQLNPVDNIAAIAETKVPILHIVSENDRVVPPSENTYRLKSQLERRGHFMEVISVPLGTDKSHGHHFEHPDPERVVAFIEEFALQQDEKKNAAINPMSLLGRSRRLLFLGDSITYGGKYVSYFDAWLATRGLPNAPTVINVGLPSETVSGLSEQGHAGGRFPRPYLGERLTRVLKVAKPDLVIACYGINCGIYKPFDEDRFERFQSGIRMLKREVEAVGGQLVLITPPTYDDERAKKAFSYNDVMKRYAEWLVSQRDDGWLVVGLNGQMNDRLDSLRKTQPGFTFQPDAVHPNAEGHWYIAGQLIKWFGDSTPSESQSPESYFDADVLSLISRRMVVRRNAYLSAAGHERPGIAKGLPISQAEEQAEQLTLKLRQVLKASR